MYSFHNLTTKYKHYDDSYQSQGIGAGSVSNDQVKYCYKCKEPLQFKKRTDGSWQLLDYYFTGQLHVHKERAEN